jgi:hypothetical protein
MQQGSENEGFECIPDLSERIAEFLAADAG